jgi:imidazoleglycerol phosphate synthase glutamine amidotransferase subunit HisH
MKQTVAVIKYNAGNVQSVLFALERYNVLPILTDDHETIKSADKVLFPGVGEASTTMKYLRQTGFKTTGPGYLPWIAINVYSFRRKPYRVPGYITN